MVCKHSNSIVNHVYDRITIYQCLKCQLIYLKNIKTSNPKKLYNNYYRNEISSRFHFGIEYLIKLFRFFRAFKLFTLHPKANSILDIGSGRGYTLYYLKKYYGYKKTVGTQLCSNAVKFSRKKLGLEIYNKDLLKINFKNQQFDLITIWHVLEHATEPEKYIKKIYKLLKNDGKIIIEVPNYNSWIRKFSGKYWLGWDLKYHLTFFTPKSLKILLAKYNLQIIDIHTFSLEYSTFISAQSIISKITNSDHVFFRWLQEKNKVQIIPHLFLFLIIFPFCLIINLIMYKSSRGEVLLISAKKK